MKNLMLGTAVFFGIFFLTPEIGKAESVYDFVEYDVKTKTERIIPFDESLYEGMPEFLEAKRPQGMPETRGIIGEDGRELVQDTTKFPFSAVAQLEHPNSIGSGALIQKNIFLTCAHAVYNNGFFSDGLIVPGRIGYWNKPFGEAKMEKIYILKEYMTDKQVGNDFALVKLDRPIGEKTGWLGLNYANKAGETFTISGYPGDKNFYMYTESQPIHETLRYEYGRHIFERVGWGKEALFYLLDSVGGQSGSPVYDSNAQISAVHNSGISLSRPIYNGGSRVSKEKFAMVNNIMNQIQKEYVPIEKIEIQQQDIILEQGDSIDLKVTVTPENATYKEIEWSEEKESAWWLPEHYVDPYGKLTGHRTGLGTVNLKVIAKSVDGGKIATSQVKVVQKKVTGISLTPEKVTLDIGDTQKLNYTIQPSNASNLAVSWSSTNNQVVSITNDGVMTGKAAGTAKIIVTTSDGNKTASSEITVNEPRVPVTGISVTPENKELFVGEKETLKATVTPENATNKKVKWSSSNEKIATVTDKGDVTAIAQGTATITAITEDGQKSAISKIKIVDNIGIEWTWDEASQTITFGAGKFPDQPYWRYNIQTHIESQSRLKGKKIKKIIFSQPVKLASSARELFCNLSELESIEGGNLLNTSTVKDMRGVFYNAPKLRSVDVSNWDTSQVTTMSNMFDGTLTLEKLNVSNWDTSQVTDMHHMFNNANKLESLDVSNWTTDKVTNMSNQFNGAAIKALDLTNWNTLSVKQTHSMFPSYLEQLKLGENIRFTGDPGLKEMRKVPYSGYWTDPEGKPQTMKAFNEFLQKYDGTKSGEYVREKNGTNFGTVPWTWDEVSQTITFGTGEFPDQLYWGYNIQTHIESQSRLKGKKIKKIIFSQPVKLASSARELFSKLLELESIEGGNLLNTSTVKDMRGVFYNAPKLRSVDVSNWDTSQVTTMSNMFDGTLALEKLNVSNWDTSQVTDMHHMFNNANKLESLDVSNWTTDKVTNMSNQFNGAAIKALDLTNWNTLSVKQTHSMFPSYLEQLKLGGNIRFTGDPGLKEMRKVPYSGYWTDPEGKPQTMKAFNEFLQKYDGTKSGEYVREKNGTNFGTVPWTWDEVSQTITFGTGEFPDQLYWGYNIQTHIESQNRLKGKKIKKIIFSQPVKLASSARELFCNLSELESIEGGNLLNTSTVKDMRGVFYNAPKLRSVDVSNWDTSQVTTMSNMFDGTLALEKLNVSNWDTSQVTDMHHMFNNANKLESLDVSNWTTDKVTNMSNQFNGAAIKALDLTNWNTLSVKQTHSMFPSYLEQLKLGENIRFTGDPGLKEMRKVPYSGYWTDPEGKPQTMKAFNEFLQKYDGTKSGEYVREKNGTNFGTVPWTWDEVSQTITFGTGEFPDQLYWGYNIQTHIESQSRLKGKKIKKIIFSQPVKLASSARELFSKLLELESIEGGNLLNTSTVKDMRGVFYNAPKLRSVDVSNWDTSQVTTMSNMFDGTLTLEKLNVSNWDTSQVTDMHHMFNNANKLESLDVSNWNTLSVKYTHSMFPNYLEQLKLGKNIRFNGDTGLKEVRTFPYSGRWVGPDGKTNPTIIYQTSKEFTQNYDGSKPGTYVRERTK